MPPRFDPSSRLPLVRAAALFFALVSLALPALVVARDAVRPAAVASSPATFGAADALPPQGLYEGCAPQAGTICIARLATIQAAGFELVLNYSSWYGTPAEVLRYADAVALLGLRLIWPLNHPAWRGLGDLAQTYPDLSEGSAGPHGGLPADAIRLVAGHSATWGFYVGDEAPVAEAGRIGALSDAVRELTPGKPQLYVARPGAARLEPFAPFVDVAGVDTYPIGSGDPPVRQAARTAQAVASEAGARTAVVLQAFSWSQYRAGASSPYPDQRGMRAMRDAAIRHADPALILWYSYQDILRSDRPRQRWCALTRAALSSSCT